MTNDRRVPGRRLRRFVERRFDRGTLDRVLLPAIADLQHECDSGAALWPRRLRAYWGLWKTIALCAPGSAARAARPTIRSVGLRMAIIFPVVLGAAMIPALGPSRGKAVAVGYLFVMSLPQSFALALPLAYFFAVSMEPAPHARRLLPAVLVMSIVCSVLMLTTMMSVMPRANQAYRDAVYAARQGERSPGQPAYVSFGPGEWTFTELVRKSLDASSERDARTARRILSVRAANATTPIMLGLVALAISGCRWPIAVMHGVWVLMFYVAALLAASPPVMHGPAMRGPTAAGILMVNALFALGGLVVVLVRRPATNTDTNSRFYIRA